VASDRTDNLSPHSEIPELAGQVRPLEQPNNTFVTRIGDTVDRIRQLYTNFGLRPYRVFLVHQRWDGGRRGRGNPVEIARREILPTPRIPDMSATNEVIRFAGLQEEGGLTIDQISSKYTEDDLMGRTPDLDDPAMTRSGAEDVEFFYEVVQASRSHPEPVRRRYVPTAVPNLAAGGFQWKVVLTKQEFNRNRDAANVQARRRER
jgi:hypothetical protein